MSQINRQTFSQIRDCLTTTIRDGLKRVTCASRDIVRNVNATIDALPAPDDRDIMTWEDDGGMIYSR